MDTNKLKTHAPEARKKFIEAVRTKAASFGLTAKNIATVTEKGDAVLIDGKPFPKAVAAQRKQLVDHIKKDGFEPFVEAIAYTWFNRFVAIRFMEVNGYLSHGYRVLSSPTEPGTVFPEILKNAARVELPGVEKTKVHELQLDGTKDEELYRMLLIGQCNALSQAMPFLFEWINDGTELLLPDNLLHSDSLIRKLVNDIPEEQWKQVEIIGWLYQFYISKRKSEVIGKTVASEDIPAATQLFTPNWIVKYLVQNTLGRQWMAAYPDSKLKDSMEYYIEPGEQTPEVAAQMKAATPTSLDPKELTFLDPACGSGHILVEAYNLFKQIYLERGYRLRDIPALILSKNLYGLEIDERAAQLAGFALMMKAREDDRRLFDPDRKDRPQPNIVCFEETGDLDAATLAKLFTLPKNDIAELLDLFKQAKTFGSLIRIPAGLTAKLPHIEERLDLARSGDLLDKEAAEAFEPFLKQANLLAKKYDFVVANPPYMGSKGMNRQLKDFAEKEFPDTKSDLFAMFIERNGEMAKENGDLGFMSPFVWMFISSYEKLRERLIGGKTITSLVQLEYSGFDGATVPICTFTYNNKRRLGFKGSYIRLSDFRGSENQGPKALEAIRDPGCGWFYRASADDFKKIPGSPVAYWLSQGIFNLFENLPALSSVAPTKQGLATGNNDRFLRYWQEVSVNRVGFGCVSSDDTKNRNERWFPCNKGGEFRKWYGNNIFVVNWEHSGKEIKQFFGDNGRLRSRPQNESYYFRKGLTWSAISSASLSMRFSPKGTMFETKGAMCFPSRANIYAVLAFANTKIVNQLLLALSPTLDFHEGPVGKLPYCDADNSNDIGRACASISRADWDSYETSWDFTENPLVSLAKAELAREEGR